MQIGISIMLAYSVFSLRLSEDVPSQSDSVHLISFYLTICMFFSLSAMTWFAIANKLRERKRLPYWIRWLAIDYLSCIVCARSMNRKAIDAAKKPTTPVVIPLRESQDSVNHSPLQQQQSLRPPSESPLMPTVWVRRPLSKTPSAVSEVLEVHRRTNSFRQTRKPHDQSISQNQESLYAIHIINRFVFVLFLLFVIFLNMYTWFFYSRTLKTHLYDPETQWTCFDESKLQIVNCNETI